MGEWACETLLRTHLQAFYSYFFEYSPLPFLYQWVTTLLTVFDTPFRPLCLGKVSNRKKNCVTLLQPLSVYLPTPFGVTKGDFFISRDSDLSTSVVSPSVSQ